MVKLTIDGKKIEVSDKLTILQAALEAGIRIPTLCYLKDVNEIAACRVCVVEVAGLTKLVTACNNQVKEKMVVYTNSPRVLKTRKTNVQLILSQHDSNCAYCVRSRNCSLQTLANDLNIQEVPYRKHVTPFKWDENFPLIRDYSKCIKCMRCIQICDKIQSMGIWDVVNTGSRTTVDVKGKHSIKQTDCVLCGQCITHCPVGALRERDDTDELLEVLADPDKMTVVQIAPAVRAAWGESLGLSKEFATEKRLVAALRKIGFDYIFDTNFSADLTIMEEGSELLEKLNNRENETFPMFTSCCPGWVRFLKSQYPDMIDQLSTAKSPQQMFGAVVKSYYAQLLEVSPDKIFSVSVMPCVAKKQECDLPSMNDAGSGQDVDLSLTTREINRLIREFHIIPSSLTEEEFDQPLGCGTGAAVIFGVTGGVMEAALRSAYYLVTGSNPSPDAFESVRGSKGWREADFDLAGSTIHVAAASGLANARRLIEAVRRGEVTYDFVEIMACPGGCSGGGGQPIHDGSEMAEGRGEILYQLDRKNLLRFSHENPAVVKCYEDYLHAPLSKRAHKLLHTNHHAWKMPTED